LDEERSETGKVEDSNISDKLSSRIIKGKEILEKCQTEIFENIIVGEFTLPEWGQKLRVNIPNNNDIKDLEMVINKIANSIQMAEYILAMYEFQATITSNFHEEEFAIEYVQQMSAKGKKKLAAEKIKQLALTNKLVDSSLSAAQAAKAITTYFKRIVSGLEESRKCIDNRVKLISLKVRLT
jgi:hypothetical protein